MLLFELVGLTLADLMWGLRMARSECFSPRSENGITGWEDFYCRFEVKLEKASDGT